tara:strand:- start:5275 stop:5688 length:414 start_codon:yes stop_codon:yes gene_type:complete
MPVKDEIETTFEVKIIRNATTGLVSAEHWLIGGKGESPPGDRPSTILYDEEGRVDALLWKKDGKLHRENGPAWISVNPETGVHTHEDYYENGLCHRGGRLPAQIRRDGGTGEVTQVMYWEHGRERFWRMTLPVAPSI